MTALETTLTIVAIVMVWAGLVCLLLLFFRTFHSSQDDCHQHPRDSEAEGLGAVVGDGADRTFHDGSTTDA